MSIVTTPVLRLLYEKARAHDAPAGIPSTFWHYYLTKSLFPEDRYVLTQMRLPQGTLSDSLRRLDVSVCDSGRLMPIIIALVQARNHEGSMTRVEAQLVEACESSCLEYGSNPLGVVIIGTAVKFFRYELGRCTEVLDAYVDADSGDHGPLIYEAFMDVRNNMDPSISRSP